MRPAPITNIKSDNLHIQVYKQLKVLLLEGHWEVGERLPSEAELCRLFGVSRISVRTALKSLIAQGFLVSRQGEGTFVVDVSLDMNMDILVPIIGLDKRNILEVLEYRAIIEVGIIPLILKNITDEDLEYLKRNLDKLEQTPDDAIDTIIELDMAFHRKLCRISENSLIIKVYQILSNLFKKSMEDVLVTVGNQTGRRYHRKIYQAIKEGNRQKAEEYLEKHFKLTMKNIKHTVVNQ